LGLFACPEAVFLLLVHPWFHPLAGLTHFLCLAKESESPPAGGETEMHHQQKQKAKNKKAAPEPSGAAF